MKKTINLMGNALVGSFFLYWGIRGFVGLAQGVVKPQLGGVLGVFFVPLGLMSVRSGLRLLRGSRAGTAEREVLSPPVLGEELGLASGHRPGLVLEFAAGPRRSPSLRGMFASLSLLAIAIAVLVGIRA